MSFDVVCVERSPEWGGNDLQHGGDMVFSRDQGARRFEGWEGKKREKRKWRNGKK